MSITRNSDIPNIYLKYMILMDLSYNKLWLLFCIQPYQVLLLIWLTDRMFWYYIIKCQFILVELFIYKLFESKLSIKTVINENQIKCQSINWKKYIELLSDSNYVTKYASFLDDTGDYISYLVTYSNDSMT